MKKIMAIGALAAAGLIASTTANAIECQSSGDGYTRTWNLSPADDCGTGPQNATSSADIEMALFGNTNGADFTKLGDITSGGDGSALMNVSLTSGSWGSNDVAGTWTLSSSFWYQYGEAVIHIHVGGGPNLPDDFAAFLVTPKSLSGVWSYLQSPVTGGGGGLSNLTLWGRGAPICREGGDCDPPDEVPEPGTLALLGLGMLGLGLARRKSRA